MKVWVVFEESRRWDSQPEVVRVFSSEAKAYAYMEDVCKKHPTYTFWAEEFKVD